MSHGRALGWGVRRAAACALVAVAVLLISGAVTGRSALAARSSPVPSCGWTPASLIDSTFGDRVRALPAAWETVIAPVLVCEYVERRPKLQFGNAPFVVVRYGEAQHFKVQRGFRVVKGLGSCFARSSCPKSGEPAWVYYTYSSTGRSGAYQLRYVSGVVLRVEDGLNSLEIIVDNPDGPLTVAGEVARVERLARRILPKFRWT